MGANAAAVAHARKKKLEREGAEEVQTVFDKFDRDGSGDIDAKELRRALGQLRVVVKEDEILPIIQFFNGPEASSLDVHQFDKLVVKLRSEQDKARQAALLASYGGDIFPMQAEVRALYTSTPIVIFVAVIILANFFVNMLEKEIDPTGRRYGPCNIRPGADSDCFDTWAFLDTMFNIIFLIELLFNMYCYGGPRKKFWTSAWNVFDTFIVTIGIILMTPIVPPGHPLAKLKLLRAFRVFRLFKRVKSLNKIIVALVKAIPGVSNAFVIMIIFFCIYAILAVELFSGFGADGNYAVYWAAECENKEGAPCFLPESATDDGNLTVTSLTARGYTNGYEYYGTFFRALYTLFQVMTGESWSEAVARPLIFGLYENAFTASLFFVSFIILTQMILVNVVVAVLLDEFSGVEEEEDPPIDAEALFEPAEVASAAPAAALGKAPKLPDPAKAKGVEPKLDLLIKQVAALQQTVEFLVKQQVGASGTGASCAGASGLSFGGPAETMSA